MNRIVKIVALGSVIGVVAVIGYHQAPNKRDPNAQAIPPYHVTPPHSHTIPSAAPVAQRFPKLEALLTSSSEAEALSAVREARQELLRAHDGAVAAQAVAEVLRSGFDVRLKQPLRIGKGGHLQSFPSVRLALLDILPDLDNEVAKALAVEILSNSQSADEWALALRNYAWTTDEAASDPYLHSKVNELLTNETWRNTASAGFLEAFDFVPFTQSPELLSHLVAFASADPSVVVRRAAKLAIATFTESNSAAAMEVVERVERSRPLSRTRADTMARANLANTADQELLRSYLLADNVAHEELVLFAKRFPQSSQLGGHFLATEFTPTRLADLARRDKEALGVIKKWSNDPRFAERRDVVRMMQERLERICASAVTGGYL